MIKTVFSNGIEDIYKGDRAVTAGWMITNKETGEVWAMGHSMDRVKAAKTAATNMPRIHVRYKGRNGAWTAQYLAKQWKCRPSQAVARADAENAAEKAKYQVEIVDIEA